MNNKTKQIIVVVSVFVLALASLGTVIGLLVSTGRLSEYSGGFSYTLNGSRATITGYDGDDTDVVVPDKVRGNRVVSIAKDAFIDKASAIKSITLKTTSSAFSLDSEAFRNMTALEKVVLPSGLKEISAGAFSGCKALREVIIPDSVTLIGDDAFSGCTALKFAHNSEDYDIEGENAISEDVFYMPSKLLEIGGGAFKNCSSLLGAHFNKALEKVGDEAFYSASAFENLTLDEDSELSSIGAGAFQYTKLKSNSSQILVLPNLVSVGDRAFANITANFTQFKFPSTIKTIGANAFMSNTAVTKIEFDEGVELDSLGEGTFQGCTYLTTIELPESVKTIPAKAFMGCTRLLYNNDFTIGKNVETIGEGAFAIYTNNATYSRKKIVVDKENENFAVLNLQNFNTTSSSGISHGLLTNLDNTVVYAYFGSFNKTSYFGEKISDSTAENEKIQSEKFRFYDEQGNPIQSITEIKAYAFAGVAFTAIRIPMTVKTFGEYIFYESEDVTDMYIESITWAWQSTSFSKKTDSSPEVRVMIYATADGSDSDREKFKMSLVADNIDVGYASASDN